MNGPPPDPRAGRFDRVVTGLTAALVVGGALAAVGALATGPVGRAARTALVVVLVAVPVLRVVWFTGRWFRRGDPRFGLVGLGVLLVMVAGTLAAR